MIKPVRELIRQRIRDLGYTHKGVAMRAQISVSTLKQILNNRNYGPPRAFTRKRLSQVLEINEEAIFQVVGATADKAS